VGDLVIEREITMPFLEDFDLNRVPVCIRWHPSLIKLRVKISNALRGLETYTKELSYVCLALWMPVLRIWNSETERNRTRNTVGDATVVESFSEGGEEYGRQMLAFDLGECGIWKEWSLMDERVLRCVKMTEWSEHREIHRS